MGSFMDRMKEKLQAAGDGARRLGEVANLKLELSDARKDLERELLDDLSRTGNGRDAAPPRSGRWAVPVVVVAIPLLATALYYNLGAKDIIPLLARAPATPPHPAPAVRTAGGLSIEQMVEKLAARLQEQPDDPEGWTMLP